MHIYEAQIGDIPVIRRLADVAFRHTYSDILSAEQIEYMMDWMYSEASLQKQISHDGHQYFIANIGETPVGYVSVSADDADHGSTPSLSSETILPTIDVFHLQKLYVLPTYQGQGIGKLLFRQVLDYLNEIHPQTYRLELNVNRHNRAFSFYKKMGMEILRQGDFPIGNGYYMNDYIMYIMQNQAPD